ncbi:ATP-binding protein [Bacillus cereus group sp. TH152-1LC]|uniref:ATP-binding protein n=1 Tax=Bacillus cereus group sp. TH152-1LC TaxID=3018060 RepID=UPI0022E32B7A|nr:ATP-binding protein [Bacillus cereus group sp. TH152-1LC]MDA1675245.1 ATP-binding protein [Bacillus cereus group sp. TH152-1LC]
MRKLEEKLFNQFEVQFPVDNDLTILIGNNGTGKTTLLKMLKDYYESEEKFVLYFPEQRIFNKSISNSLWYLLIEDKLAKYGVDVKYLDIKQIEDEYIYSGFHQIVNFFGSIMTTEEDDIVVIIDEPERHLSIEFQEMLINDLIQLPNVCKVIVASHSPFIASNHMSKMLSIGACTVRPSSLKK